MEFEWDAAKDHLNRIKHGISFETASLVFDDPLALSFPERSVEGEERWRTIGSAGKIILLTVASTCRNRHGEEIVRIISARKATSSEPKRYEETN